MVPPPAMVTTKNRAGFGFLFGVTLAGLLVGCTPPGPKALLEGQRLLDAGDATNAILKLQVATSLLPTNAAAWNYLGLAYHRAGQVTNAAQAYQHALTRNPDLSEARFNLGCLWFEQNQFEPAKTAFIAYTLRRPAEVPGWLKLGLTQLYAREPAAAEKSFREVLRLSPKHPQALNGLGLAALQRNRPVDAVQQFAAAIQTEPVYRPALLNLAVTLHRNLGNRPQALQRYRQYLALAPRAADWDAVNATVQALEQEVARPAAPPPANVVTQAPPPQVAAATKPATNGLPPVATVKSQPATNNAKPAAKPILEAVVPPSPSHTVQVSTLPEIKVADDTPQKPLASPTSAAQVASSPSIVITTNPVVVRQEPAKRSFVQKINPINLFRREAKTEARPTPLKSDAKSVEAPATATPSQPKPTPTVPARTEVAAPAAKPVARYAYQVLARPVAGNRAEAERAFTQGVRAQEAGRLDEAIQAYRGATQADPTYFDAQYNLGLAAAQAGAHGRALLAYETALVLQPDSMDTRYNFALVLKQAGYYLDAVNQLERLVANRASETRARLALANLYAEQLRQPGRAREQYTKVLELEPRHPQGDIIRRWLVQNPG